MSDGTFPRRYPTEFIEIWKLRNGSRFLLRPVLPQDETLIAEMVRRLSPTARGYRFHGGLRELSQAQCRKMSCVDFESHVAVVVTCRDQGGEIVVAEARYAVNRDAGDRSAEFALVVEDYWQRRGLGFLIMNTLILSARNSGLQWLYGDVLVRNEPMLKLMRRCGFCCSPDREDPYLVRAELALAGAGTWTRHNSGFPSHWRRWWRRLFCVSKVGDRYRTR
ncbi:GNAT family N-acetyltransferase [Variovorax sp. KBS0712]|uniref:GNAT family N-acetyltransferase n=1 Tax=Variovorax sp. KBS0712 TaxID=2578111 RepID=UPI001119842C|nr:GNAT family N-acetyltransferase [Variovorax sp. KBS0712]